MVLRPEYNLRKSVGITRNDDFIYDKPICLKDSTRGRNSLDLSPVITLMINAKDKEQQICCIASQTDTTAAHISD
jgi:hypothetical protein